MGYGVHNSNQVAWQKVATVRVSFSPLIPQYNWCVQKQRKMMNSSSLQVRLPLEVVQGIAAPPTLQAPPSAYLVLAMPTSSSARRTRTATRTLTEAPTTGHGGLRHDKNSMALQCYYVRQVLVSWTWFFKISLLSWRRMGQITISSDHASCTGQVLSEQEWVQGSPSSGREIVNPDKEVRQQHWTTLRSI